MPDTLLAHLQRRLAELLRAVPADTGLLSITLPLPALPPFQLQPGALYWARPRQARVRLGVGAAVSATARGHNRLAALGQALEGYRAGWHHLNPEALPFQPQAFLGFAFHPEEAAEGIWRGFPNALLRVPELLLERAGPRCAVTFTTAWPPERPVAALAEQWCGQLAPVLRNLATPRPPGACPTPLTRVECDPPDPEWLARAERTRTAIRGNGLHKAVLTRRVRLRAPRPLVQGRLLAALAYRHPCCTQLAVASPHGTLLAATPERLVTLHGGVVESDALAGTAPRAPTAEADRILGESLLADPKSRHEHQLVVAHVAGALAPLCSELEVPETPRLAHLRSVQHLWTPVRGRLRNGAGLLDLAARLHPTPAVGGTPQEAAASWLAAEGEAQRGWYTGAAGWVDPQGAGELNVVLRCALVQGDEAHLFAGAGLVGDSSPEVELAETELKLAAMLEVLADG